MRITNLGKSMTLRKIAALATLCCVPLQGTADTTNFLPWPDSLGLVAHSTIEVFDDVSGNCWTRPNDVKSKVHLLYAQNEIFVPDYEVAAYGYITVASTITATGFRTGNGVCAVMATFRVGHFAQTTFGGWNGGSEYKMNQWVNSIFESQIVTSGSDVNDDLESFFTGAASSFLAKHLSAKSGSNVQKILAEYPPAEKPLSREKWDEMVAKAKQNSN